jgi:hypothetical protein
MKKIFISVSILGAMLLGTTANAQEISYGIKGGYNFANVRATKKADITNNVRIGSFVVSTYLDINFSEHFSLQTGLAVNGKGSTITVGNTNTSTWTEYKSNPIYLELPVNAVAKIPVGDIFDKCNIILGGGPYVALGVSGKNNITGKKIGIAYSAEENISFSNKDQSVNSTNYYGEFKKYDFGLNALAGIEYHWATFNINYAYGLVNVNPGANLTAIDRMKNRVWSFMLGVRF